MNNLDVIALGGNAILPVGRPGTIHDQVAITRQAMERIADLLVEGRRVVLTHGNGPIVGNIVVRNEAVKDRIPPMPLDVCGADSQGGVGYMIQQTLGNVLRERGMPHDVVSIVTQVRVSASDPAFEEPVKPIGPYYAKEEADALCTERGWRMIEDSGRGYRRVVASPYPLEIVEGGIVEQLVRSGTIAVTLGGGGIPVVREGSGYHGREAVIDKDISSALLARNLRADRLIIVTNVDAIYERFGTDEARPLRRVSLEDIRKLYERGEFPAGSMGAKIQAAIDYLEAGGRLVVVCQPADIAEALAGERGTTIHGREA